MREREMDGQTDRQAKTETERERLTNTHTHTDRERVRESLGANEVLYGCPTHDHSRLTVHWHPGFDSDLEKSDCVLGIIWYCRIERSDMRPQVIYKKESLKYTC